MVWIVKKGISCLLILLGVTFVTFALMYLAGGDAISYFYEKYPSIDVIGCSKAILILLLYNSYLLAIL